MFLAVNLYDYCENEMISVWDDTKTITGLI